MPLLANRLRPGGECEPAAFMSCWFNAPTTNAHDVEVDANRCQLSDVER
jgi:hypothetical protein